MDVTLDELAAVIVEQQVQIRRLLARVAQLEQEAEPKEDS